MTLIERLRQDRIQAMKDKDVVKKSILSLAISNSQSLAKESRDENPTDEQVLSAIKKLCKGNKDLLESAPDNEDAKKEIGILESYLPQQLSEEELRFHISEFIALIDPNERSKSMGKVMSYLKEEFSGRYDGKLASSVAKELL